MFRLIHMAKKLDGIGSDWSKVVGMPDAWDKKNIANLVDTFCKATFDIPVGEDGKVITMTGAKWIMTTVAEAKARHQLDDPSNQYGVKSKQMEMRVLTSVPRPLFMKLKQGYPTLFSDYKQHVWFAKNFPMFKLPEKI